MATSKLSLEENTCPVCMYILIQPVTMPCNHELCLPCFKQNVEEANFCCPMCRLRISTWARKASRNKVLVNQERWQEIMRLFPEKVNKRLNGIDDDEDLEAAPVCVRLAKPGEIRTEYEEQLRKLRQEYAEQRRKEQEASEQLIRQLQEQEKNKREELDNLEKQDEELAKELSEIMNKTDLFSPYRTRSGSVTSESGSVRSFIESVKPKNEASTSPYPYPCFTPTANGKVCVDKDKALLLEEKFQKQRTQKEKHLLTTQDLLNLERQFKLTGKRCNSKATATVAADSVNTESRTNSTHSLSSIGQNSLLSQDEILQQMSEQLDLGVNLMESPDCIIIEPKNVESVQKKELKLSQKNNRNSGNNESLIELVELESSPVPNVTENKSKKMTVKTVRSASAQSNDSISTELAHFRPIRACPLTPPRQLSGGKVIEPVLIRTTPRNLSKSLSTSEDKSLSDIDASSPIMQKCLEQLEEERKDKVLQMSKSTTTSTGLQNSENKNPDNASIENLRKQPVNGLNILSRATEFKDISNSPLPKRKCEFDEGEQEEPVKRKKLIIPLEPDLNENDDVFEVNPFQMNLKLSPLPTVKKKEGHSGTSDLNTKTSSRSRSKSKVKYKNSKKTSEERSKAKDGLQSAITKWTLKQDVLSHNSNNNVSLQKKENDLNSMHDSSKMNSHKSKKDCSSAITIDTYFGKSAEKKPKLRSREQRRQLRFPEYDYQEISPRKRKLEQKLNLAGNGAISKLSFNSEGSESDDSEPVSERLKDFELECDKKRTHITSCEIDDNDDDSSYPVFKTKRNKVDTEKVHFKKRFKSEPSTDKVGTSKHKAGNISSDYNKTVDVFFKVNRKPVERADSDKTIDTFEGMVCGNTKQQKFAGFIDQEEQDRLFALELQKQFDFEHKYHLNTVRLKGSEESYSFRNHKKPV